MWFSCGGNDAYNNRVVLSSRAVQFSRMAPPMPTQFLLGVLKDGYPWILFKMIGGVHFVL